MNAFSLKDGVLCAESTPLPAIAERFGTPCYVYSRAALETGYGTSPVDIGVGGSIPFIADLVSEFPAAQILVTGVEDPHARAHSPNESLHLDTFRRALVSEALLLESLDSGADGGEAAPPVEPPAGER